MPQACGAQRGVQVRGTLQRCTASAQELKIARTMKSFASDGRQSDDTAGLAMAARAAGAGRGLLEITEGYYPTCQGSLLRPLQQYVFL